MIFKKKDSSQAILEKNLLKRIKYAVMTGKSDEDIKAELFMFFYCISYMKKDKNGNNVINDFSSISVSDESVVEVKLAISENYSEEVFLAFLYRMFFADCMTEEEHEEIMQKVLAKARERRLNAYKSIRYL